MKVLGALFTVLLFSTGCSRKSSLPANTGGEPVPPVTSPVIRVSPNAKIDASTPRNKLNIRFEKIIDQTDFKGDVYTGTITWIAERAVNPDDLKQNTFLLIPFEDEGIALNQAHPNVVEYNASGYLRSFERKPTDELAVDRLPKGYGIVATNDLIEKLSAPKLGQFGPVDRAVVFAFDIPLRNADAVMPAYMDLKPRRIDGQVIVPVGKITYPNMGIYAARNPNSDWENTPSRKTPTKFIVNTRAVLAANSQPEVNMLVERRSLHECSVSLRIDGESRDEIVPCETNHSLLVIAHYGYIDLKRRYTSIALDKRLYDVWLRRSLFEGFPGAENSQDDVQVTTVPESPKGSILESQKAEERGDSSSEVRAIRGRGR